MTTEFDTAKAFLMQADGPATTSVYDHLSELIGKLLNEKPNNAIEILENLSYELKANKFNATSTLHEQPEASESVLLAKSQERLLKYETEVPEEEEDSEQLVPNVPELARHFEDADIGLGREETFRVFLALKQLTEDQPLKNVTFWGKATRSMNTDKCRWKS
jgi:radial spoke head protein 4A